MYKIKLSNTYKSLFPFESEELNGLTIITGKNGSGKTQLLELISKKLIKDSAASQFQLTINPTINKVQYGGVEKESSITLNYSGWQSIIDQKLYGFNSLPLAMKKLLDYLFEQGFEINDILKRKRVFPPSTQLLSQESEYTSILWEAYMTQETVSTGGQLEIITTNHEEKVFSQLFQQSNLGMLYTLWDFKKKSTKKFIELKISDFYQSGLEILVDSAELFSSSIEMLFYNYARKRDINIRKIIGNYVFNKENDSIPDAEFIVKNPEPWRIINEILAAHNIQYYFEGVLPEEFDPAGTYSFNLLRKDMGVEIPFSDLSSGERIIIGLIIKLFINEYYGDNLKFPQLIILDEPDAHLHPEMSKLLIDVLDETFVKKLGIKVIISTHSPSTIALAPEAAVFELKNGPNTSLRKVTKDDALKLLTNFIPTLSINYKNHRQVFVESPTDLLYYQTLYEKYSRENKLDHQLYFISNAMGEGNCDQVYATAEALRSAGNQTCLGIVDWDCKNSSKDNVLVHGVNERYSIENFLLDPIYLIILMIDMNNAHSICQLTGLSMSDNQYAIGEKASEELQDLCDIFFKEIENKHRAYKANENLAEIHYLNSKSVKVPGWFLTEQGHGILEKITGVFDAIGRKYNSETNLLKALILIMSRCYPFVPLSSIKAIETLASSKQFS